MRNQELYLETEEINSLLLESQDVISNELYDAKDCVRRSRNLILQNWSEFMGSENLIKSTNIENRLIVLSTDIEFQHFIRVFTNNYGNDSLNSTSAWIYPSYFIAIGKTTNRWSFLSGENKQKLVLSGNPETIESKVQELDFNRRLVHETIHAYQNNSLPTDFKESAVSFYTDKISKEIFNQYLLRDDDIKRARFYQLLIYKYGNNVHRLFFGSRINPLTRYLILRSFSNQVAERLNLHYNHQEKVQIILKQ